MLASVCHGLTYIDGHDRKAVDDLWMVRQRELRLLRLNLSESVVSVHEQQRVDEASVSDVRWFVREVTGNAFRLRSLRFMLGLVAATIRTFAARTRRPGTFDGRFGFYASTVLNNKWSARVPVRSAPDFDDEAYLRAYPDVSSAVSQGRFPSGFAHFVLYGRGEKRTRFGKDGRSSRNSSKAGSVVKGKPNAASILAPIQATIGDVLPLVELDDETRLLIAYYEILRTHLILDSGFYRKKYLHGAGNDADAILHYVLHGSKRDLWPNEFFDPTEYYQLNPDVSAFGIDAAIHYVLFGWKEGRSSGSRFSGSWYLSNNPDVRDAAMCPLSHFLSWGRREGRAALAPSHPERPASGPWFPALPCPFGLRSSGTILCISHDMEIGGAQHVVQQVGSWLLRSTKYDVRFVAMRGGARHDSFGDGAPAFDVSRHSNGARHGDIPEMLRDFAGPNVKAIFLNSVASAGFLDHWTEDTPVVAYVHELSRIIELYGENIEKIKSRASIILAGSMAVRKALIDSYGVKEDRCAVVYSFIEGPIVDRQSEATARETVRRGLGVAAGDFVVMGCGVMHWRKSPEKFIEVADRVATKLGRSCRFVWIGGGPDEDTCRLSVREKRLDHVVDILGYREDVQELLLGADVFLLPSEEDPFPLVCLYAAAAGAPVICFEEAGGMPEFVARGCGVAVPFGDVGAMAEAVRDYFESPELRALHGEAARNEVLSRFTVRTAGPEILNHIRRAIGAQPRVSIVVPNYNYDRYLDERLSSILDQSFQDFELILLDDASTDGSRQTLQRWAEARPGTLLVVNETNSGSPFHQWLKGMQLAHSDLIWIAEADDACSPRLLERLLPALDNRNVFMAYAKSKPVGEDGRAQGDYTSLYLGRISDGRWTRSYVEPDNREVNSGLGIANSIPNASAVVFRRFVPEHDFSKTVCEMRICGDWYFYLRAIRGGFVAYVNEALNFHRRHGGSVISALEGSERYFAELLKVRAAIARTYRLSDSANTKAERFLMEDLDRFKVDGQTRAKILEADACRSAVTGKARPSLLVVTPDLSPGGGQMFAIRLANAWEHAGGRAFLLNARRVPDHPKVLSKVDPRVAVFHADSGDFSLRRLLLDLDIDVVHSCIWWADKLVQLNSSEMLPSVSWVVTMHGCYETLLSHPETDPSFPPIFKKMLGRVDHWIYTAEKNLAVFQVYGQPRSLTKLDNGYEPEPSGRLDRQGLGLKADSFVLCLASRAIFEKGWREAAEATTLLNSRGHNVELMLIGEGPEAELIKKAGPKPFVHLFGQVQNLSDYIAVADVGLLPSFFVGESMPLVIIEFMAQGKPTIATDVGEIRAMLEGDCGCAGVVVPLQKGRVSAEALASSIELLLDPEAWRAASAATVKKFGARYSMRAMLESYSRVYARRRDRTRPQEL